MLQYVRQIAANFVCLMFGVGQVAYSGFIRVFCSLLLLEMLMRAVRLNQNSKAAKRKKQNKELTDV